MGAFRAGGVRGAERGSPSPATGWKKVRRGSPRQSLLFPFLPGAGLRCHSNSPPRRLGQPMAAGRGEVMPRSRSSLAGRAVDGRGGAGARAAGWVRRASRCRAPRPALARSPCARRLPCSSLFLCASVPSPSVSVLLSASVPLGGLVTPPSRPCVSAPGRSVSVSPRASPCLLASLLPVHLSLQPRWPALLQTRAQ